MDNTAKNNREGLVTLQRQIFEDNKRRIAEYEQILTPDFEAYEARYTKEVETTAKPSSTSILLDHIRSGDIAVVGDYHTLHVSQKSFLKLARRIRRKRVVIGLELFEANSQEALDAYVLNGRSERTLLRRSGVIARWPYDIWPHFKPIVDLARQRGWRVLGLDAPRDTTLTLEERDQYMADALLRGLSEAHHNTLALTLVGELHVASEHFRAQLKSRSPDHDLPEPKIVSVFQNSGPIYWQLVEQGREHESEVLRLDPTRFCINSAPPIVVQQSYLNWIEYSAETLEYDHLTQHFKKVLKHIEKALSLRISSRLGDIQVFGPGDVSYYDELPPKALEEASRGLSFGNQIDASRIFFHHKMVYLSNLNLNHVGEVVGRLIHCTFLDRSSDELTHFYSQVLHTAIGFFVSKLVNPKRKAHQPVHFRRLLKQIGHGFPVNIQDLEVASAVLLHKSFEQGKRSRAFNKLFECSPDVRSKLIEELGYMLGEKTYYAFERGHLSRTDIRTIIHFPSWKPEQSTALYFSLCRQVQRERIPKRM